MIQSNKITYICNAGVLIELNGKKIMIDGLSNSRLPIYKSTPDNLRNKIENGEPPFDNIDIMIFTHYHTDHFNPYSAIRFLKINQNTYFLSSKEVISYIEDELKYNRIIELNYAFGEIESVLINDINIQAIPMIHDGKEYKGVQNFAYLINSGEKKIFHTGDAKATEENYSTYKLGDEEIDLLIAPFPYIGTHKGRHIINNYIIPKKIAAVHFPYKELDNSGWLEATKKNFSRVKDSFIETVFLEEIGEYITNF